jgi:hypothetical protein
MSDRKTQIENQRQKMIDETRRYLVERCKDEKIWATCTWGEASDVTLSIKDKVFFNLEPVINIMSKHGICLEGQIQLTKEQAQNLGYELLKCAEHANDMEPQCDQYFEKEK